MGLVDATPSQKEIFKEFTKKEPRYKEAVHKMDFVVAGSDKDHFGESVEFSIVPIGITSKDRHIKLSEGEVIKSIPKKEDLIYRGMSGDEYYLAIKKKFFKSRGGYNIGESQKGLTFGTTSPDQAAFYSTGFQPIQKTPTPEKPGYVIGFKKEGWFKPKDSGIGSEERAKEGIISFSEAEEVYKFEPKEWRKGRLIIRKGFHGIEHEGSTSPDVSGGWKKIK